IAAAAAAVAPGPVVGHCSGATGLDPLAPHEAFSLHPLMTVTHAGARFAGAGAAIAGSTPRALAIAAELATALGMHPVQIGADEETGSRQREAVAERTPDLTALFDALVEATRALAAEGQPA